MNCARKYICICVIGVMAAALTACTDHKRQLSLDVSRNIVLYNLEKVEIAKPEVYVHPAGPSSYSPNALILPLRVTQKLGPQEAEPVSKGLTRIFWQAMLKEEAFPILEYDESVYNYTLGQAMALAYSKGADVVITGDIPYMITGGSTGMNQLVVHLEMHDVHSGELLWSLTSSGALNDKPDQDFIFFKRKTKLPQDSLYTVATALGANMGKFFYNWSNGGIDRTDGTLDGTGDNAETNGGSGTMREPPAF